MREMGTKAPKMGGHLRMSPVDRLIARIDPIRGFRRMEARLALRVLDKTAARERAYEGAARGRRTEGWMTTGSSANAEVSTSIAILRNRARDLVRNNPFAGRGVDIIANNTVGGTGMNWKIEGPKAAAVELATELWKKWSTSTDVDADGIHNLAGLQDLVMRATPESGEALIRRRIRRASFGKEIPLQLQVLEGDYLDHSRDMDGYSNGGRVYNGIRYDKRGQVVSYFLHKTHPGDLRGWLPRGSVEIEAKHIAHVFMANRPGQNRGVTWLAPVILRLRDLDEFQDATLFRQKLANCFTGFVFNSGATEQAIAKSKIDTLEPGAIEHLNPGEEIKLANPPGAPGYPDYVRAILHEVATGLGVTYAQLTGDLSQVNFSSSRMGWLEFNRNVQKWQQKLLVPQFLNRVFQWFLEAISLSHNVDIEGIKIRWTAPRREMIDPSKEIEPLRKAVRAGFVSWPEAVRQAGYDPAAVLEEIQQHNAELDQREIILDTDPRKVTISGNSSGVEEGGLGDEGNNDGAGKPDPDEDGKGDPDDQE